MQKIKFNLNLGASLLEVLIGIVIAAILLVVIGRVYFSVEQAWLAQQNSIANIEKTNVAYAWFSRDITHAGYLGCVMASKRKKILGAQYLPDADWLRISDQELFAQYMGLDNTSLLEQISAYQVSVSDEVKFKKNQIIIIENCQHLMVNKIKKVSNRKSQSKQILTLSSPIIEDFVDKNTRVGKLIKHKFLIKKTSRKKLNNKTIYSLYVKSENNRWNELIAGVNKIFFKKNNKTIQIELHYSEGNVGSGEVVSLQLEPRNNGV